MGSGTLTVADVMRKHVHHVQPDSTVGVAARQLVVRGIEALLVVEHGHLVGIVTERDLLTAALPTAAEIMDAEGVGPFADILEVARGHSDARVADVMTRFVETIAPTASITRALGTMLSHRLRRLPLVDPGTGELLGVITQRDVLGAIFVDSSSSAPGPGDSTEIATT